MREGQDKVRVVEGVWPGGGPVAESCSSLWGIARALVFTLNEMGSH